MIKIKFSKIEFYKGKCFNINSKGKIKINI